MLEAKKTYVRYISHELRTPLNSGFLGLKLITEELGYGENQRDRDLYETAVDVSSSVSTAVEILDGLLCFD